MRYPSTAVIFEIRGIDKYGDSDIKAGTHVEGAGPCCIDTNREWKCKVLQLNGCSTDDMLQWIRNLKPLTKAARDMLAIIKNHKR